jgi:hypothetical protein
MINKQTCLLFLSLTLSNFSLAQNADGIFANNKSPQSLKRLARAEKYDAYIDQNRQINNSDGSITAEIIFEFNEIMEDGTKSRAVTYTYYCSDKNEKKTTRIELASYSGPNKTGNFLRGGKPAFSKDVAGPKSVNEILFNVICSQTQSQSAQSSSPNPNLALNQNTGPAAILGDKELRDFLSENWPQWGKREIEHAINSEAADIKKSNPNFTTAQINAAVKDLWYKRAGYKNNPETRPNAKNTLASRKGFNGQLESIDSQVELEGACVAIAQSFVNNARGSAFDTRGAAKWSICAAQSNITNTLFTSSVSKWRKTFQNDSPVTLGIYLDQCYSKIIVQWDNSTGKCL